MKWLKPMSWVTARSRTAVQVAPLWETKAREPGLGISWMKEALSAAGELMMPTQLGPTMRTPAVLAAARMSRSRAAPSSPVSLPPPEMMMAPPTPQSPHSHTMAGANFRGTMMTARSRGQGAWLMEA